MDKTLMILGLGGVGTHAAHLAGRLPGVRVAVGDIRADHARQVANSLIAGNLLGDQALAVLSLANPIYFVFATMPAMTQMGIMARETGSDYEFAAVLITVTTILSMAAIPIYMGIVTHFHLFL